MASDLFIEKDAFNKPKSGSYAQNKLKKRPEKRIKDNINATLDASPSPSHATSFCIKSISITYQAHSNILTMVDVETINYSNESIPAVRQIMEVFGNKNDNLAGCQPFFKI